MNREKIKAFCKAHPELVSVKETSNPDLRVLKYKNKVFYKDLWTPELLEMRGTIIDKDWNVIQRPFTKIFNFNEKKAPKIDRDEIVGWSRKINGFMACATFHRDKFLVSTTGTIDSEFADLAREKLKPYRYKMAKYSTGYSWMFEIVDESDPHIVEEEAGIYLLNIRCKYWDAEQRAMNEYALDDIAKQCKFKRPEHGYCAWNDLKIMSKSVTHEGYVAYTEDGRETKIKSRYYLVTKFLGRMGDKNVEMMFRFPETFKERIDEEFYSIAEQLTKDYTMDEYMNMNKQDRINMVRLYIDKEYL